MHEAGERDFKNGIEMGIAQEMPKLWTVRHDGKLSERGTKLL